MALFIGGEIMDSKLFYMKKALRLARKAFQQDEVPVGAVIVHQGKVIASAYNLRNTKKIATAHAEVLAINKACKKNKDWRLEDMELYVTLEPCIMCSGAIILSRIGKVYFGAYDKKGGALVSSCQVFNTKTINHHPTFEGGILEEECSNILKEYFKLKRNSKVESNKI